MRRNSIGALSIGPLATAMPGISRDAEFYPGTRKTWSLAFMLNETRAPTGRNAGSMSWAGVGNTYF